MNAIKTWIALGLIEIAESLLIRAHGLMKSGDTCTHPEMKREGLRYLKDAGRLTNRAHMFNTTNPR